MLLCISRHLPDRVIAFETAKGAGVDQPPLGCGKRKSRLSHSFFGVIGDGKNDQTNFEMVFLREFVVALIVGGHAHDGSGAVFHENVVGDPDGHFLAVERVDGVASGVDSVLLDSADVADFFGLALFADELIDFGAQVAMGRGETGDDGMLRRELYGGGAEDGVYARGEDRNL